MSRRGELAAFATMALVGLAAFADSVQTWSPAVSALGAGLIAFAGAGVFVKPRRRREPPGGTLEAWNPPRYTARPLNTKGTRWGVYDADTGETVHVYKGRDAEDDAVCHARAAESQRGRR